MKIPSATLNWNVTSSGRRPNTCERMRQMTDAQRELLEGQRRLSADIQSLIARIDALLRGRGNGNPPA